MSKQDHNPVSASRIVVLDVPSGHSAATRLITLRRPDKLNCLSLGMLDDLLKSLHTIRGQAAVVLMGAGRSFCSGIDLSEIGGADGANCHSASGHLKRLVDIYKWFLTTEVQTIVLARGYAAGGGTGLVACANTVVVSEDFRFKLPGDNLARFASVALPLVEWRTGKEEQSGLLGKELDATQARTLGLVDGIVSPSRLTELETALRSGTFGPELAPSEGMAPALVQRRSKRSVEQTVRRLDRFLMTLEM